MPKQSPLPLIVVFLAAVVLNGGITFPDLGGAAVTVPAPSATDQAAVAPVTAVLRGKPNEAKILSRFFADMATVASKLPERFDSIAELEAHINVATPLLAQYNPASVPGLNKAVADALGAMLGSDEAAKVNPVAALNALAWAAQGAG
jgi:hypothetical protein